MKRSNASKTHQKIDTGGDDDGKNDDGGETPAVESAAEAPMVIANEDEFMLGILKLARTCTTPEQANQVEGLAGPVPDGIFKGKAPPCHPRPAWFSGC